MLVLVRAGVRVRMGVTVRVRVRTTRVDTNGHTWTQTEAL